MSAIISPDGKYRYHLERQFKDDGQNWAGMLFIMLNPSKADADKDDNTIKRCIRFAKRDGWPSMAVVNLFAYRATDPRKLAMVKDPEGPENRYYVEHAIAKAEVIVVAWGAVSNYVRRSRDMLGIIDAAGKSPMCLGVTKDGHPKHPLYLKNEAPLVEYKWRP